MPRERVLVIDTDSAVYACGFMAQHKTHFAVYKGKVVHTETDKRKLNKWIKEQDKYPAEELEIDMTEDIDPVSECIHGMSGWIHGVFEFSGCDRYIILLTKGGNDFRSIMATILKYKGNRDGMARPVHYDALRRYLRKYHNALIYSKWEADDAAAMAMHRGINAKGAQYILAAIDKDLDQVQGARFNPNKKDEGVYVIDELDAWFSFYRQMLEGDKSDNIKCLSGTKGHPGIGKVKATNMLKDCETAEDMCKVVLDAYRAKYGDEPFEHTPWWWRDEHKEDPIALEYRKNGHPVYGVTKTLMRTYVDMFRENADLLYMLRTPDDQYVPHIDIPNWTPYPNGTVKHYLG